jgi:tRNA isopentenyl-2-thiomethyl-A-37 hydroxylase MiaE
MNTPKTSIQWWNETKSNPDKLIKWLKDQYHGEVTASKRIITVFAKYDLTAKEELIIARIATEEVLHAMWIAKLLVARGLTYEILEKEERYWEATLDVIESKESAAALAHLAEAMRLERIRAIAEDESCDEDVRNVFKRILPMEIGHEAAFKSITTPEAIEAVREVHESGRCALGLVN